MAGGDTAEVRRSDFPEGFVFGVATSAYQVEGARKEGGKGDSIWDVFSETKGNIRDGSNGDIAVDQYHRYKEDVELIAKLGFGAYRFSISWSRIFPDGLGTKINEEGLAYYNNVIDFLLEKGIQPYVTLYHWDLPYNLHESVGGWLSEKIVEYFARYAEACFANFGDRVKHWITINEPLQTSLNGYGVGIFAPGICSNSSVEIYLSAHNQLLAHAAAAAVYRKKFKASQCGEIGLVVDCEWAEAFSDKLQDKAAAERWMAFQLGWYLDPIFYGDYPAVMRERLGDQLPKFLEGDKELLQNSVDFVGLNHYTSKFIAHANKPNGNPFYQAQEIEKIVEYAESKIIGDRAASEWLYIVPWGMRKVLNYITEHYHNTPIYITENGMDDEDNQTATLDDFLNDKKRARYFKEYLLQWRKQSGMVLTSGDTLHGHSWTTLSGNKDTLNGLGWSMSTTRTDSRGTLSRQPSGFPVSWEGGRKMLATKTELLGCIALINRVPEALIVM